MVKISDYCCVARSIDRESQDSSSSSWQEQPWEVFTLKQLIQATNNFSDGNKLGEGGFGTVYWGRTAAGAEIAVKRLKAMSAKAEMEFAVEVEVLGRVRHKNLLSLRGYYAGGDERLIVYDYMPNRSLLGHLHGFRSSKADPLLWRARLRIALGAAAGIAYLHHAVTPRIIHRDIKASNVLLDSKFRPKVADFGFAKLIPEGVTHMTSRVKGTLGYLAPEYAMWGKVSESCDIYGFGILLLEIVTARHPIEKLFDGAKRDILQWAIPLARSSKWDQLADPRLSGRFDPSQLRSLVIIAIKCTDGCPGNRPDMRQVVHLLRSAIASKPPAEELMLPHSPVEDGNDNNGNNNRDVAGPDPLRINDDESSTIEISAEPSDCFTLKRTEITVSMTTTMTTTMTNMMR